MRYIDLSHSIHATIPVWPGDTPFTKTLHHDYPQGSRCYDYHSTEGIGTHIDAPAHFIEGGRSIADLSLDELIGPACIIDVRAQVQQNSDYAITADDISQWEQQHGPIPNQAIIIGFTGWSQYWPDCKRYQNCDANNTLHFPGFSKQAAEVLMNKSINGVGIDTLSIDPGNMGHCPVHHVILGANKFQLENLTNLAKLPALGATIYALPIKVQDGPEAAARVIACIKE